jgi:hypothetical protein
MLPSKYSVLVLECVQGISILTRTTIVRDHKGVGCNVALIECTWVRENPKGVGISEGREQGARWGTGGVSLRATWDCGEQFLSQLGGFQVSKGEVKGKKGGTSKGRLGARGMRHV